MSSLFLPLLLATTLALPALPTPPQELRYQGTVLKLTKSGNGEDATVKRFSVYFLLSPQIEGVRQLAFVVEERGSGTWAWPERYGAFGIDPQGQAGGTRRPRVLYEHAGVPSAVTLPLPWLSHDVELKPGVRWTHGDATGAGAKRHELWEVTGRKTLRDRDCWEIEVKNSFGRKKVLWVEVKTSLLVAQEERFFAGQGEEHKLTWQLAEMHGLTEKEYAARSRPVPRLLQLQTELKRPDGELRAELADAQLKLVAAAMQKSLVKDAAETPFAPLVAAISRDVEGQRSRGSALTKLAGQFLNQPAPRFSLYDLQQQTYPAADRQGKITVLHFWEYPGEPLVEPYGQVGYLDFLYEKRRKLGVQVYGVAVDHRLADPQLAGSAIRSIQKLKTAMNLSYSLALDDGKLLEKFGDPRGLGAKLPLWVVIAPDGKIVHYHAGFYRVNPDEGLQELDAVLIPLIRQLHQKPGAQ